MNTILHLPIAPWLSLAWPRALLRRWARSVRPQADPAGELDELSGLDARTLRDIGAPEPLLARELARHAGEQWQHDHLAIAALAGDWRRW